MKTIVITGAAHGLGKALANHLKGENLILIDRDLEALSDLSEKLDATMIVADISKPDHIESIVDALEGKIDVLINNAGLWISGDVSFQNSTQERLHDVIGSNVYGSIALITGLFNNLKDGLIININSQSGVVVEKDYPVYNASKHATKAFTKAIQDDLAKYNIRITDIHPGLINTGFYERANDPLPKAVLDSGLDVMAIVDLVQYILDLPNHITLPSIEIKDMRSF